jgi:hypothetical protein
LVTKENGIIVLNPHVANCCVLRLDEQAARVLLGTGHQPHEIAYVGDRLDNDLRPAIGRGAAVRRYGEPNAGSNYRISKTG